MKRILFILSLIIYSQSFCQYDKPYLDSITNLLNTSKYDSVKVRMLLKLGMYYKGEAPSKAKEYLEKAYNYKLPFSADEQSYKTLAASNLTEIATATNDSINETKWIHLALQHASKANYHKALQDAYEQAGIFYMNYTKYDSSIMYYQKIIDLFDSLKMPEEKPQGYFGLANIFQTLHQYAKTKFYLNKCIELGKLTDDAYNPTLIPIYQSFAEIFNAENKFDSVIIYCNKYLPIARRETYYAGIADVLALKSSAETELKNYDAAIISAREGYTLSKQNDFLVALSKCCHSLAIAFASKSNKDSALFYGKEAEALINKSKTSTQYDYANTYGMWANIYNKLGDYKLAFDFKQKELQTFQQIKDEEIAKATAQSEVKFETNKKEQKISELSEVTAQQKKINWLMGGGLLLSIIAIAFAYKSYKSKQKAALVLEQSNKEKEVFLKEIHHRVKNNLQIISSLLFMQFKDTKDEAMIDKLKQAQQRIKTMALVHNKLYEKQDVVHVYFKEYINDLAKGILISNNPEGKIINLKITGKEDVSLSLDTSISVGLILNELITNSCKYAFANKDAGNIEIDIQQNNNVFALRIKDDGQGLPQDFEQKNSLGVRLIKNLARQLQGTASFENNNGTMVNIEFKEAA